MVKPHRLLWGAWVKWHVLSYLGMKRTKRLKHLLVTDDNSLQYWVNIYRIKQQP